jgi:hypothetical protein
MTQRDQRQYAEIILGDDIKNIVRKSKMVENESRVMRRWRRNKGYALRYFTLV